MKTESLLSNIPHDSFCSESLLDMDKVVEICKLFVDAGDSTEKTLLTFYETWKEKENCAQEEKAGKAVPYQRGLGSLNNGKVLSSEAEKFREKDMIGIDLPIWFSAPKDLKRNLRVMIVGRDPQRNAGDFGKQPGCLVGTPYALHDKRSRNGSTRRYADIVGTLINQGCDVYLTDVYKAFQDDSKAFRSPESLKFFKNILIAECNLFSPDLIITFGAEAYSAFCDSPFRGSFTKLGVYDGNGELRTIELKETGARGSYPKPSRAIRILPLLHPSNRAAPNRPAFCDWNKKSQEKEYGVPDLKNDASLFITIILHALDKLMNNEVAKAA